MSLGASPAAAATTSVVSRISVHDGPVAGKTTVIVTGRGFARGAKVYFGSTLAQKVQFMSSTGLRATSPAHVVGTVDVTVQQNHGASTATAADRFTFHATPKVTSVTPSQVYVRGGDTITIAGSNFGTGSTVTIGGSPATGVVVVSTTRITAKTPAHAVGSVDVRVKDSDGTSAQSASDRISYVQLSFLTVPTPTITGSFAIGQVLTAHPGIWSPVPTQVSYQWYRDGALISDATSATYTLVSDDAGSKVTVSVTATKAGLPTTSASSAPATIPRAIPSAPEIETVTGVGLGVSVQWTPNDAAENVTSYDVVATPMAGSSTPDCPTPTPRSVPTIGNDSFAYVGQLCAGVVYTAHVVAVNSAGAGSASAESSYAVPFVAQAPNTPFISAVTARDGALEIDWSAPAYSGGDPITGYSLSYTDDAANTTVVPLAASATSYTITGLVNSTPYSLQLTATNDVGASDPSNGSGTPAPQYAPKAPLSFTAVPVATGKVALSWQPPTDNGGSAITGYAVTYQRAKVNDDGSWSQDASSPIHTVTEAATATTASITSFDSTKAFYLFTIAAKNSVGTGSTVSAGNPVAPVVALASGAVVLSPATVAQLLSVTDSALIWRDPVPAQVHALIAGQTVVATSSANLPTGTLRKVTGITDIDGITTVATEQGELADVTSNVSATATVNPISGLGTVSSGGSGGSGGSGATSGSPLGISSGGVGSSGGAGRFVPSVPGIRVVPQDIGGTASLSTSVELAVNLEAHAGSGCDFGSITDFNEGGDASGGCVSVKVAGSVKIEPSVNLSLVVHQDFVGIPDGVTVAASAKAELTSQLTASISGSYSKQIGDIEGAPVDIQAGPVPIVIVPKFPVFLNVTGTAAIGVKATITVGGSISWSSSNPGQLVTQNLSTPLTLDGGPVPSISRTGELTAGLQVQPQLDLYDIGGPNIEADLDMKASINFNPDPGEAFLTIGPELSLKAGLDLDVFGLHASLDETIASTPLPSFSIDNVPPAVYIVTPTSGDVNPGASLAMTATRNIGATEPITWSILGGTPSDSISSTGVFTPGAPEGRTVVIEAKDTDGAHGQATVQIGAPFDTPGVLTASQSGGQPFTANLTWTAPVHTGGSPIGSYRVSLTGGSTQTTSATSATITGLSAGSHVVSVTAVNGAGTSSAPATTTVTIDHSGALVAAPGPTGASWHDGIQMSTVQQGGIGKVSCAPGAPCVAIEDNVAAFSTGTGWTRGVAIVPANHQLTAISCLSSSFCAVVDNQGYFTTYNGISWSAPVSVSGSTLTDVSCVSAVWCTAVNLAGVASTWNGSTWTTTSRIDPGQLKLVSCTSASFCVAMDASGAALTFDGSSWTAPTAVSPNNNISGLTCVTSTFCMASNGGRDGRMYRFDGTTWTTGSVGLTTIIGVSCSSTSYCMAADSNEEMSQFDGTTWVGPHYDPLWGSTTENLPAGGGFVQAVSCGSPTVCAALTTFANAVTWNGTTWSDPHNFYALNSFFLQAPSCGSISLCVAVDYHGNAATFDGTTWSVRQNLSSIAQPSYVSCVGSNFCVAVGGTVAGVYKDGDWQVNDSADYYFFQSVSCVSTTYCVAVDDAARYFTFDGSDWSAPTTVTGAYGGLSGISCVSTTFCMAVDGTGHAMAFNGSSWTAPVSVDPNELTGISCASQTFCAATDGWYGTVAMFNGTAWGPPVVVHAAARPMYGAGLETVACPSSSFCIAVDGTDDTAATFNGSEWSGLSQVGPAINPNAGVGFDGISCVSTTYCVATTTGEISYTYSK